MHCAGCAKKIANALATVPGVAAVQTDLPTETAIVAPHEQKAPSPRALWEAVEKAGFQPVKLQGPAGTFTSKPKS
jgi:Cu+-exporting ATPase